MKLQQSCPAKCWRARHIWANLPSWQILSCSVLFVDLQLQEKRKRLIYLQVGSWNTCVVSCYSSSCAWRVAPRAGGLEGAELSVRTRPNSLRLRLLWVTRAIRGRPRGGWGGGGRGLSRTRLCFNHQVELAHLSPEIRGNSNVPNGPQILNASNVQFQFYISRQIFLVDDNACIPGWLHTLDDGIMARIEAQNWTWWQNCLKN